MNSAVNFSRHHLRLLYKIARSVNGKFRNRFDLHELVAVGWLSAARFMPEEKLEGRGHWIKGAMYKWVDKELKSLPTDKFQLKTEIKHNLLPEVANQFEEELERLSPIRRRILTMKYLEKMSMKDIAKELGCSRVTVYNHLKENK